MSTPQRLTNGQALLLDLFHQDLSEKDLQEVRNLVAVVCVSTDDIQTTYSSI
jgi:hypothetical protein